jgi:hypothetical protein
MTVQAILNDTEARVREALPGLRIWRQSQLGPVVQFPLSANSDYRFSAWFFDASSLAIEADISSLKELALRLDFWQHPFKAEDFASSEEMVALFQDELLTLLTHETRIIQRKRPHTWEFACEVYLDDWTLVHQTTYDRGGKSNVPPLSSREHVYRATGFVPVRGR